MFDRENLLRKLTQNLHKLTQNLQENNTLIDGIDTHFSLAVVENINCMCPTWQKVSAVNDILTESTTPNDRPRLWFRVVSEVIMGPARLKTCVSRNYSLRDVLPMRRIII